MSGLDCGELMPSDGTDWPDRPECTRPQGHRGYHRAALDGIRYDWPPSSEAAVGADQPGS